MVCFMYLQSRVILSLHVSFHKVFKYLLLESQFSLKVAVKGMTKKEVIKVVLMGSEKSGRDAFCVSFAKKVC